MTRSPDLKPDITNQRLSMAFPKVIFRCSALLSFPTTHTRAFPSASRISAPCGINILSGRVPVSSSARTYIPGNKALLGLENAARNVTLPVASSTAISLNLKVPFWE
ncbi:hypothetical protein D3C76_1416580 [compost metagenome]